MLDSIRQDVAYAARGLARSPGFALVAVATLTLGIGGTSAIFSVVNAVLLKPLPYPESERLIALESVWKGKNVPYLSPQNFLDIQAQAKSCERMAAIDGSGVTLTGQGEASRLDAAHVS